ncbi:MAG: hypothetical protein JNL92_10540 [Opitutaceae bacterium]|nr:hypothetical protein [Opitutaceae bacterium]
MNPQAHVKRAAAPRVLAGFVALLVLSACQRDPLDRKVSAATPTAFSVWRSSVDSDSGLEVRRRVADALLEIRFKIAGDRELQRLTDAETRAAISIDDAVRAKVDGRVLREVVQWGYELRVDRLTSELAGLEEAMRKNANLITRPGDIESRHHLDGLRDRQAARVAQYRADLAAAERELAPLLATTGRRFLEGDARTSPGSAAVPGRD